MPIHRKEPQFQLTLLLLLVLVCGSHRTIAQFGIHQPPKERGGANENDAAVGTHDDDKVVQDLVHKAQEATAKMDPVLLATLQERGGAKLKEQDTINVAHMIQTARADPETKLLLESMRLGSGKAAYDDFQKQNLSPAQIVEGLAVAVEEIKMLEFLFQDPQRAFVEMSKEGMIEKRMLKTYEKDPALLEEDTRKGLYFTFVALAAAGGYL